MAKQEVTGKRAEIKKIGQQVFITVCVSAAAMAMILIGTIYLTKTIIFNAKVLEAKDATVEIYKRNTTAIRTLNEEVLGLANNESLETVALKRDESCVGLDGQLIDFEDDVAMARRCSALRVIPDAMPWRANASALGASLAELLKYDGITKETDSVGNATGTNFYGLGVIDANYAVRGSATNVSGLLDRIERSIRPFTINIANLEWRATGEIALTVSSQAYYVRESVAERKEKKVTMEEGGRR